MECDYLRQEVRCGMGLATLAADRGAAERSTYAWPRVTGHFPTET